MTASAEGPASTPSPAPSPSSETDDTIAAWADATFGPIDGPTSGILRALEEAVELRQAIRRDLPAEAVALEIADVAICLVRPMQAMQTDPPLRIAEDLGTVAAVCHDDDPRHLSKCLLLGLTKAEDLLADDYIGAADDAAHEMTGVAYLLHALALLYCAGGLSAAVAAKMAINRRREWRLDGTGHGSHVKASGCPGVDAIAEERRRQVDVEGWTTAHDDGHEDGEMSRAAAVYLLADQGRGRWSDLLNLWPWDTRWLKVKDRRRNLERAGALIAAELARLDRLTAADSPAPAATGLPPGEAKFAAWFRKNYPGPDTIIHDPDWHAPRIYRAVLAAHRGKSAVDA